MNESFYRKVRRADTTAKWMIMSIGIGIIGLVITILVVIASVAAPLFRPASIRSASETAPSGRPGLLAAGMDEYLQNAYGIDAEATIHFTPLATNATARTESLKRDTPLLAAERTGPDQYTLLYADGVARSVRVNFPTRFDAATQAPTTLQTSEGAVNVDAASEYARVQALTGGRSGIAITPRRDTGFKLPGL